MRKSYFAAFIFVIISLLSCYWLNQRFSNFGDDMLTNISRDIIGDGQNGMAEAREKVIYLTFDDGPSTWITGSVLDILREKNVKGTFFVIGEKIKGKEEIIRRMYDEGHSIGLHTYTHNFRKIYKNHEAFIGEMDRTADEVYNVIGIRPRIIRFPGGSVGQLSRSLYEKLRAKDYRIYDWNARTTDGLYPEKSPQTFYNEAVKSGEKWSKVVMLMHCDAPNINTCRALPVVIDYYKKRDYVFKVIDDSTPEYYFRFDKKKKK